MSKDQSGPNEVLKYPLFTTLASRKAFQNAQRKILEVEELQQQYTVSGLTLYSHEHLWQSWVGVNQNWTNENCKNIAEDPISCPVLVNLYSLKPQISVFFWLTSEMWRGLLLLKVFLCILSCFSAHHECKEWLSYCNPPVSGHSSLTNKASTELMLDVFHTIL